METKTKTTFLVLEESRDQDPKFQDYISDILPMFFLYFLNNIFSDRPQSQKISGTAEQIFTKFSGLVELFKSLINASIWQAKLPWHPMKVAKSVFFLRTNLLRSTLNVAASHTNFVRFDVVTPE